eukprot:TRINITY_DN7865_c0_g1_i3.p1 TRINITY_DN7865_c0_g1~~TRINITY_DN7865_c0_g1_i3.p1  ORF type:complete len:224 (-),score=81.90 TRINITY_DN7865_c0_g1_i3:162-833(-)
MLAEDSICDPRNLYSGFAPYKSINSFEDLVKQNPIKVDYRGDSVSVDSFIKVLTGRHPFGTPFNKMMRSNKNSKVFIYLTGHGGNGFFKFRDYEIITSREIATIIDEMYLQKRFKELLFITDTCQANTLFNYIETPNVFGISSSDFEQNSFSVLPDSVIGLPLADVFTFELLKTFEKNILNQTIVDWVSNLNTLKLPSTIRFFSSSKSNRNSQSVSFKDFFYC